MNKIEFKIEQLNRKEELYKFEMLIDNKNVLAWNDSGEIKTTQWDISGIIDFLVKDTIEFLNTKEDFEFVGKGSNLCELINDSFEFEDYDNEDDEISYLEGLNDFNFRHSWHHASNGAIIANMYFREINNCMEISWDNSNDEENYLIKKGCALIDKEKYIDAVIALKNKYYKLSN